MAAAALTAVAGCRADTIRTTSDAASTTTVAPPASRGDSEVAADGTSTTRRSSSVSKATSSTKGGGKTSGSSTTGSAGTGGSGRSGTGGVSLSGSSLGPTSLGTPSDTAVASMKKALGPPSRDLRNPGARCPGPDRLVSWGRFSLYFSGGKLAGWGYDSEPAGPPQLTTPAGITIGSSVAALRKAYGQKLTLHPADTPFPAGFSVPQSGGDLTGTLTGTADTDTTTSLAFGLVCGE